MRHLSPRELADALGVSESSLKRWVDSGKIAAFRTDGGHRRITVNEAVRFVRETQTPIARPELLGLPELAAVQAMTLGRADRLLDFLLAGDAVGARGFLLSRYLSGTGIAELADGPIREAMQALGELWRHQDSGVFVEHQATDTCIQAVAHLRNMLSSPPNAPLALGAAPEDDPYILPSFLAAMVATVSGLRTINLGPDTPLAALQHAVQHHRPSLIWMSASTPVHSARARAISRWLGSLTSTVTVVGGRHGSSLAGAPGVRHVETMAQLAELATKVATKGTPKTEPKTEKSM